MKTAIMQPYFFPYLGYWQLFSAVDNFVLLDDVNYIKRGYINRNNILVNNQPHRFSISMDKPSQNKLIKDTKLNFPDKEKQEFLKMIQMTYKRAPQYNMFYPLLEQIVLFPESDLTTFLKNSFEKVSEYLGLHTTILVSSQIDKDNSLKAQDRIIEINKRLGTNMYINAIGGKELYNAGDFKMHGMDLRFIQMGDIRYKQFNDDFVPNLSLIDVLMFNSAEETQTLLKKYQLIQGKKEIMGNILSKRERNA